MTSYNRVNGVYAPNSYDLCTKLLRNEWGFDGVVMTDWFSTNGGQADNGLCMTAGNDLIMPGGKGFQKKLIKAVKRDGSPRKPCGDAAPMWLSRFLTAPSSGNT
jgi:beta-glucosidase